MSSFKSSENIQKKKRGPDRSVSDNQSSSVTLNELAMKARKSYCNFKGSAVAWWLMPRTPDPEVRGSSPTRVIILFFFE